MTTYTIPAELLQELISNCMASIAEDGISDARRVYRTELHHRANLAMRNLQPNTQEPVAWMQTDCIGDRSLMFDEPYQPSPLKDKVDSLFTHPATQTEPLTDDQIDKLQAKFSLHNTQERSAYGDAYLQTCNDKYGARKFARAIEAAHGVKP